MNRTYPLFPDWRRRRRSSGLWAPGLWPITTAACRVPGQTSDADLAYLPANAAAVGYADVRSIMSSEFRQKLRAVLPTGEEKDKFQAELGVDIERDIDTVAAAYLGGGTSRERRGHCPRPFQRRAD